MDISCLKYFAVINLPIDQGLSLSQLGRKIYYLRYIITVLLEIIRKEELYQPKMVSRNSMADES